MTKYRAGGRCWFGAAVLGMVFLVTLFGAAGAIVPSAQDYSEPAIRMSAQDGAVSLPWTGQPRSYYAGDDGDIQAGVCWPEPRFTNPDDTTPLDQPVVVDRLTGLMWTREGTLPGIMGVCYDDPQTWQGALTRINCLNNANYQGYNDWRLANAVELESLVSDQLYPWIQEEGFTNSPIAVWTSTSVAAADTKAWTIQLGLAPFDKQQWTSARMVRTHIPDAPALVWRTGQTVKVSAGDDGDKQAGIEWPVTRFTDNNDGTVTDHLTGLMWLKDADCMLTSYPAYDGDGAVTWKKALDFVAGINADTYANCGGPYRDWRLPNRKELISLVDYSRTNPALPAGHPFINVHSNTWPDAERYWSSTTVTEPNASHAWGAYSVFLYDGSFGTYDKTAFEGYVWPVRVLPSDEGCVRASLPILTGDSWSYFEGRSAPPTAWKAITFNDASWPSNKTPFGYGGNYILGKNLGNMEGSYRTLFIRKEFWVEDPAAIQELFLAVNFDDGYIAYLNGQEVRRTNVTSAAYNQNATSDHPAGVFEVTPIYPDVLVEGKNVLAVQGHNLKLDSSDFYLDAQLTTEAPIQPLQSLPIELGDTWKYLKGIPTAGWKEIGFNDNVYNPNEGWFAGRTGIGYGDDDDATVLTDMQNGYLSVYARIKFVVTAEEKAGWEKLALTIDYDDGFVAYLNGTEVLRANLEGNPPPYMQPATTDIEPGEPVSADIGINGIVAGENVLAIEIHNAALDSDDLTLRPELIPVDDDVVPNPFTKGPYLQNVTQNSIVVMWQTSTATPSRLRFKKVGDPVWMPVYSANAVDVHELTVTSLNPSTDYLYQVSTDGSDTDHWIAEATMSTTPDPAESFRAVVYGDMKNDMISHRQVVNHIIANHQPDLVLLTGDYVGYSNNTAWQNFFTSARDLMIDTPFYPALGNHEHRTGTSWIENPPTVVPALFAKYFSLPDNGSTISGNKERWYAFSYGCARIIVLDANRGEFNETTATNGVFNVGTEQHTWLLAEFASPAFQNSTWQIVILHPPLVTSTDYLWDDYATLWNNPDKTVKAQAVEEYGWPPDLQVADILSPLFETAGVDLVFTAHNHRYEHALKNNVHYYISAGAGSPSYPCGQDERDPDPVEIQQCIDNATDGLELYYLTLDVTCGANGSVQVQPINADTGALFDPGVINKNVYVAQGEVLALTNDTSIQGDWTNDGIFLNNWRSVLFNGLEEQFIGGSSPSAFFNLAVTPGATVDIPAGDMTTVDGALTNNGTLRQTQPVSAGNPVDFLTIDDSYLGIRITASGGGLGDTTVAISGEQTCPGAETLGSEPVARCYEISPTARSNATATIRLYYLVESELNGNDPETLRIYRQEGNRWVMEQGQYTRETDGGFYDWVQVTGVDEFARFAVGNHVAIDLTSFKATALPSGVAVSWETAAEPFGHEFAVWRATNESGPYTQITPEGIPATGGITTGAQYTYIDQTASSGMYYYKLEDIDVYNLGTLHGPVGVSEGIWSYLPIAVR